MPRQASTYDLLMAPSAERHGAADLYAQLRGAILAGQLAPGARLPASRVLAASQGVARGTVVAAYEQLIAEGYLQSRVGSGTRVSAVLPDSLLAVAQARRSTAVHTRPAAPPALSQRGALLARSPFGAFPLPAAGVPFAAHVPALQEFPVRLWATLAARQARALGPSAMADGDAMGHLPLRQAIAEYLGGTRGLACRAEQVLVLSSVQQAVDLAARLLLDAGDAAWCEDPGYAGTQAALRAAGVRVCPVPVDDDGMVVAWAQRHHPQARLACVTPAHQAPLGMSLSLPRRLALLDWARRSGGWILEDDYDSEYRYSGKPLPPLRALQPDAPVLYVGCFSKTLFPALRVAYLVLPEALVDGFAAGRSVTSRYPPILDQLVLAAFMREGHYARHLRRMRQLYAERRALLVQLLQHKAAGALELTDHPTGLNLPCWLAPGLDIDTVLQRCQAQGLVVLPLRSGGTGSTAQPRRNGLLLGFASLAAPTLRVASGKLARALDG
ncbi:MAG: PLP-dependent aminotransferase family protein [Rhodoferax sp.]|nr:PLP-dependent aminotransferase family protein [Rhodoferax sp.]